MEAAWRRAREQSGNREGLRGYILIVFRGSVTSELSLTHTHTHTHTHTEHGGFYIILIIILIIITSITSFVEHLYTQFTKCFKQDPQEDKIT